MNTDTLLKIYQTYSFGKISALSKKGLAAQYAQCEQLVKLKEELASNTSVTNRILRNQIKELERQEKVRYYKKLIFNIKLVVDKIENINVTNLKLFLSSLFLQPALIYANDCMQNVEDITDKVYANNIIGRINNLLSAADLGKVLYRDSYWSKYLETKDALDECAQIKMIKQKEAEINSIKQNEIKTQKSQEGKSKIAKGCLIFSFVFLFYITIALVYSVVTKDPNTLGGAFIFLFFVAITLCIWKWNKKINSKYHPDIKYNRKIEQLNNEIAELNSQKKAIEDNYSKIVYAMSQECPDWEDQMDEILQLLPKEIDSDNNSTKQRDPLLKEASIFIVKTQQVSISSLQRKFNIGYNRASIVLDQLEKMRIVGAVNSDQTRTVLCKDLEELNAIFKHWALGNPVNFLIL